MSAVPTLGSRPTDQTPDSAIHVGENQWRILRAEKKFPIPLCRKKIAFGANSPRGFRLIQQGAERTARLRTPGNKGETMATGNGGLKVALVRTESPAMQGVVECARHLLDVLQ